jgi:hypothetical protein
LWLFGGAFGTLNREPGYLNDLWRFNIEKERQALLTLPLTGNFFCAGNTLNISYTATNLFNPGNAFTAQLSDARGSFTNPVIIGSVSGTSPGSIEALIPASTPAGSGYRVRVVASLPDVAGTDNGTDLFIKASPAITVSAYAGGGLTYQYFEGSWNQLPDFGGLNPVSTGTVANIDLSKRKRDEQFALLFQGKLNVPKPGWYYLETFSDDGSKLYIGNYGHYITPVVDNDGLHAALLRGGWYHFPTAGKYDIAVSFFEREGEQQLKVYWGSVDAGIAMHTLIPDDAFTQPGTLCTSQTLIATEGDSYLWSTGATTRSIQVDQAGSYTATVTKNGCSGSATTDVVCQLASPAFTQRLQTLGATVPATGLHLAATPNPSSAQFAIRVDGILPGSNALLVVSDALGRVVEQRTIAANGQVFLGAHYRPGVYHLQLVQGINRTAIKIIKAN